MLKQRSKEWFEARRGKFTASEIHRLLGDGRRDMTEEEKEKYKEENPKGKRKTIDTYGTGLVTFAFEKAVESLFGIEEDTFVSEDMKRGIALEPHAFKLFKEIKACEFIDVKESTFVPYGKNGGSSSDGECSNQSNLEIKCPKRNKFFKYVANGSKEIDKEYYCQMQMQMLSNKTNQTYFFNYYIENGLEYWHEIIVKRDEELINKIKERLEIACKIRDEFINKLKQNQQW